MPRRSSISSESSSGYCHVGRKRTVGEGRVKGYRFLSVLTIQGAKYSQSERGARMESGVLGGNLLGRRSQV